jgi:hypothetical protein
VSRRSIRVVSITLALAMSAAVGSFAAVKTAPGSFLSYRANSVRDLVQELTTQSDVAKRYAAHFRVKPAAFKNYLNSQVKLAALKRATVTPVYYVNSKGQIVKGRRLLPAGTMVFMNRSGQLVLDWRCGNPLTSMLPQPFTQPSNGQQNGPKTLKKGGGGGSASSQQGAKPASSKVTSGTAENPLPTLTKAVEPTTMVAGATEALPVAAITSPVTVLTEVAPSVATIAPVAAPPVPEVVAVPATTSIPAGIFGLPRLASILMPAALVGAAAATVVANSGGGGGAPIPSQPVPEPASLAALSTGLMGIAVAAIGRRRNRR